ncbi:unnamed protein product [Nippostrongylus brasiliensis]|uniref:Secreted protein n=1 Tax=Nippostrongylus brasiliensis TaxID=27835 RepID=A0A0N4XTV5_NIPBR|nr:unnamed protein product [Nippostrongylus brasiliensis]
MKKPLLKVKKILQVLALANALVATVVDLVVPLGPSSSEDEDGDESDDEEDTWTKNAIASKSFIFDEECGPHSDALQWRTCCVGRFSALRALSRAAYQT